jgi:hypothetical protein
MTHGVISPTSIDALRKVYSINLSETSTPRGMQLSSHHGEWGGKPANRPESRIGRPYKTQNDFGFRRSANDSLASRIANFRQYAVPWHGDPRIVDERFVAIRGGTRYRPTTIGYCAASSAIGR